MTDTLDLDAEISLLEARKVKLERLHALRLECAALEDSTPSPKTITELAEIVARHRDVSVAALFARGREQYAVDTRAIVFFLARKHTSASTPLIGRMFNRDHGTVLNGVRIAKQQMATDLKFARLVGMCEAEFLKTQIKESE